MRSRRGFVREMVDWVALAAAVRPFNVFGEPHKGEVISPHFELDDRMNFFSKHNILLPEGQGLALSRDKGPNSAYAQISPPVLEGLRIWQGKSKSFQDRPLGYGGHGMATTGDGRNAIVFEKWGQNASIIDLEGGRIKSFSPYKNCEFYGHGVVNADGSQIFVAEVDRQTGKSLITIRDIQTGALADVWKYDGIGLHDLAISKSEGLILAPFSGRQMGWTLDAALPGAAVRKIADSYLGVVDARNGKLREEFRLENQELSLTHVTSDPFDDKRFYLGTTPRNLPNFYNSQPPDLANSATLAPVFGTLGNGIYSAKMPSELNHQLKIEIINVAVDERNDVVAFTASLSGCVLLHRRSTSEFLKVINFGTPISGILPVPEGNAFFVTGLGSRRSWLVSAQAKHLGDFIDAKLEIGRGSHLYAV
jgi:hypothetical protein